jgi:GT2 family glycosyltransferase/lipopolysaccharide biosynthesis regulator YciM
MTSIIVLTYNQLDYTKKCLESILLFTERPFKLILVDNASTDGTGAYLESLAKKRKKDVKIHIIRNPENFGFAGGNNMGIAAAEGDIVLLNNDTIVTEGWLNRLIACASKHSKAGIIGPMSNYVSGPQLVRDAAYNTRTAAGLKKFAGQFARKNIRRSNPIMRVVGFCMYIKRGVVDKIGGLDDRFGKGNFEDDDFSIRAALAGFESWIAEDCFIHHFGSRTFAGAKIDLMASLQKNWQIFKDKWGLPESLPYGSEYRLSDINFQSFDPSKHYIPLPGLKADADPGNNAETENLETNITGLLDYAKKMAYKGQLDNAVKTLLKGISISEDNKRIYYSLAEILINEKRWADALEMLSMLPADSGELKKLELAGCCKEALGHDAEAEQYACRMLDMNNRCAPAFFLKGKLALKKSLLNDAEGYFLQAITSDEAFGLAYSYLGLIKKIEGLDNEALDFMEKGFIFSPAINEVLNIYHKESRSQKTFYRAEQIFRNALKTHPNHRLIQFKFIDLLLQQEKFNEATTEIEKAVVEYGADDGFIAAALHIRRMLAPNERKELLAKKGTISLCMIVKNEEKNIGRCLLNLKTLVDEMIIVDTGSSDRTKSLAGIFGAKVYDFEWNNDFSTARNFSLSKACGDWILIMDADEVISPRDFSALKKIIKAKKLKALAFSLVTRNYHTYTNIVGLTPNDHRYIDEEAGYGWVPSGKVRLFKNGLNIKFDYPVHEAVEPSLKKIQAIIAKCPVPVHHYGKLDLARDLKKGQDYYYLGVKKLEESPDNAKALFELAIQAGGLKKWEEAISLWEKYIILCPDNPTALLNLGTAFLRLKNFQKAMESTQRAMELNPDASDAVNNYAAILILQGRAEISIPILESLEKKFPDNLPARVKLAVAHACTGKKGEAFRMFEVLKDSSRGSDLFNSIRDITKELASFGLVQYTAAMIEMTSKIFAANTLNPKDNSRMAKAFNENQHLSG